MLTNLIKAFNEVLGQFFYSRKLGKGIMLTQTYLQSLYEQAREMILDSKNTKTILFATAAFLYASYL